MIANKVTGYSLMFLKIYFCSYLQAMARDPKNHYQETARQIRRKVEKYRKLQEDS
jgi:hypothetical protein